VAIVRQLSEGLPPATNQRNTGRDQLFEPQGPSAWGSRYVLEENVRVAYATWAVETDWCSADVGTPVGDWRGDGEYE